MKKINIKSLKNCLKLKKGSPTEVFRNNTPKESYPLVSIIISNYNGCELLRKCLLALSSIRYESYEVIVVDANSTDGSQEMVKEDFPQFKLIPLYKKIGIGEALNVGIINAKGKYLVLDLNNDDLVSQNWLNELVNALEKGHADIVGGKRYLGNTNTLDSAGGRYIFGLTLALGHGQNADNPRFNRFYQVDYVPVLMIRKNVFDKIGLLDTSYFIYGEDVDFCLRAKLAGYKILYSPKAIFRHHRSSSIGESSPRRLYYLFRSRLRLMAKVVPLQKFLVFLVAHILVFSPLYLVYYAMILDKTRKNGLKLLLSILNAFTYFFFTDLKKCLAARRKLHRLRRY